jgi:hypothetical protein
VRITLSQEASLWEPNMFHSLLNHLLRIYDWGSQEEIVTPWSGCWSMSWFP